MIAPGAIVRCQQTGDIAWVVESRSPDGCWRLLAKSTDRLGRAIFTSRTVGERDLIEVVPASTYEIGSTILHNGAAHIVVSVGGDFVELVVPASRYPLKLGGALHIPSGNVVLVAKADLVLEELRRSDTE